MSAPETLQPAQASTPPPPIPTRKRFFWGLGGVTEQLTNNSLNGLMDSIYVNAMGLDPKIVGMARSLPRLLDLITDPIQGHLSDNTRSRWGRRRPWMAGGALLIATLAILMWHPPLEGPGWMSTAYVVGICTVLFTIGYSMFMIPYTAQGYELSTDYTERNHIFKWRIFAFSATGFLSPWILPFCLWLEGPNANITRGAEAVKWVSVGIAAVILITACGPIFGCRETTSHVAERKTKFIEAFRLTMRNRSFWPLALGNFFARFGMAVTGSFFYFVMVYSVSGGDNRLGTSKLAIFSNTYNIATFLGMFVMVRFTDRLGKKPALMSLMLASALAYASLWFTFRPAGAPWMTGVAEFLHGTLAVPVIIAEMWPILISAICIGMFTFTMPMVVNSMLADVCDVDELQCGQQRQAFYGAMFVTCDKLAMAVAILLQGFLISLSGYSSKLAVQSAETISFWMKALIFTQPVGFLLGFLFILAYPITRAKAMETRRLIDARRNSPGNSIVP